MDAKKWSVNAGKRHIGRKDSIGGIYMRYILITGINFNNKGAEAMMFHLYYYLQKKWPDKKVVALCKNSEQQLKNTGNNISCALYLFIQQIFLMRKEDCVVWQGVQGEYRARETVQICARFCAMRICALTQVDLFFQVSLDFWIIIYG